MTVQSDLRCFIALITDNRWTRLSYGQRIEIIELILVTERHAFELQSCWPNKKRQKTLNKIIKQNVNQLLVRLRSHFGLGTPGRHIWFSLFTPSRVVNMRLEEYWTYLVSKADFPVRSKETHELLQSFGRLFVAKSKCRASLSDMVNRADVYMSNGHVTTTDQITIALRILKQINGSSGVSCGVLPRSGLSFMMPYCKQEGQPRNECFGGRGGYDLENVLEDLSEQLAFTPVKCIEFSGQDNVRTEQIERLITDIFVMRGFALIVDGGDVFALSARAVYCCVLIVEPETGDVSWFETSTPTSMKKVLVKLLMNSKGSAVTLDFARELKATVPFIPRSRFLNNHPVAFTVCAAAVLAAVLAA